MKYSKVFFFSLVLIFYSGCNVNEQIEEEKSKYSGITQTAETGPETIGTVDSTDWYDVGNSSGNLLYYGVYPAYPNPTKRYSNLKFSIAHDDSVKIWIDDPVMDKDTTVLINRRLAAGTYLLTIDFFYEDDNYKRKEGIARVFIEYYNTSIPLIHGDIQINN